MEMDAGDNLDGDNRSDCPVDDEAERRPPPRVGDEMTPVLPEVLQPVASETDDEQPWGTRDRNRGYDDEHTDDAALHCDYTPAPVSDREADVHRSDQHQTKGVNRCRIKPPESERRRRLEASKDQTPQQVGATERVLAAPMRRWSSGRRERDAGFRSDRRVKVERRVTHSTPNAKPHKFTTQDLGRSG
jgi:hypothetical protein